MSVQDTVLKLCRKAPNEKIGIICNSEQAQEIVDKIPKTNKNVVEDSGITAIFFSITDIGRLNYTRLTNVTSTGGDPVEYCKSCGYDYYDVDFILGGEHIAKIKENYSI